MAENPSVYQIGQIGIESPAGTPVAATKRFTGIDLTFGIKADVKRYRPGGYRFNTVASLSKEWSEIGYTGPATYSEIVYLLCSLIKTTTGTGASANKTWVFAPTTTGSDARTVYTLEHGSADRARQASYAMVSGMTLTFGRDEVTVDGSILAKAITDGATLTALTSANEIALVPIMPTQGSIKLASAQSGLAGASALTRAFAATFVYENVSGPVWPINASASFAAMVDLVPAASGTMRMAVDAASMALLTNLRAGSTHFARINYAGDSLGGGTYQLQLDVAMKITDVQPFSDEDGVYAVEWNYEVAHDSTWGKGFEITVVNAAAAL